MARDHEEFSRKVCELAADAGLRERLSERGLQVVRESFAYDGKTPSVFADLLTAQATA